MHKIEMNVQPLVTIFYEDEPMQARQGDTVAAALLARDQMIFRVTPVTGAPRGPFCMMGVCFDCLVEIDGATNRQACMTPVVEGMRIKRQNGAGETGLDIDYDRNCQ